MNISHKENTVWLTQKQMALLFSVTTDNISLHIKNILKDNELDNSVAEECSITASDGKKIFSISESDSNLISKLLSNI